MVRSLTSLEDLVAQAAEKAGGCCPHGCLAALQHQQKQLKQCIGTAVVAAGAASAYFDTKQGRQAHNNGRICTDSMRHGSDATRLRTGCSILLP